MIAARTYNAKCLNTSKTTKSLLLLLLLLSPISPSLPFWASYSHQEVCLFPVQKTCLCYSSAVSSVWIDRIEADSSGYRRVWHPEHLRTYWTPTQVVLSPWEKEDLCNQQYHDQSYSPPLMAHLISGLTSLISAGRIEEPSEHEPAPLILLLLHSSCPFQICVDIRSSGRNILLAQPRPGDDIRLDSRKNDRGTNHLSVEHLFNSELFSTNIYYYSNLEHVERRRKELFWNKNTWQSINILSTKQPNHMIRS